MDLGVREWMIIIGVLLIVAVVLDGYRRVRNERRGRIRVSLSRQARRAARTAQPSVDSEQSSSESSELPNGGARPSSGRRNFGASPGVPVLMQAVDEPEAESLPEPEERSRVYYGLSDNQFAADDGDRDDDPYESNEWLADDAPRLDETPAGERDHVAPYHARSNEPSLGDESRAHSDEPAMAVPSPSEWNNEAKNDREQDASSPTPQNAQELLVLYVISKDRKGFKGQDLLQILLACDVRYGKSGVFHRSEQSQGRGPVQFSVANLIDPGTFDLDRMDQLVTPGVCFYLTLPGPAKAVTAFNYMVETAHVLVKNLDGEMRDEGRSVVTQQTLEHCRQRIRDFERRQLTFHL